MLVPMGVFGAAHGVRGEVRLKSYTADPMAILSYGTLRTQDGRSFELASARLLKDDMLVAKVKGVADRDAAERLVNLKLFAPREVLGGVEEDEFFHADLIGLDAVAEDGKLARQGDGPLRFRRRRPHRRLFPEGQRQPQLYPFTKAVVPAVDLPARRITFIPPVEVDEGEARPSPSQDARRSAADVASEPPSGPWRASVLTLYPEMFPGPLGCRSRARRSRARNGRSRPAISASTATAGIAPSTTRRRAGGPEW